jgi:hypothetical protein
METLTKTSNKPELLEQYKQGKFPNANSSIRQKIELLNLYHSLGIEKINQSQVKCWYTCFVVNEKISTYRLYETVNENGKVFLRCVHSSSGISEGSEITVSEAIKSGFKPFRYKNMPVEFVLCAKIQSERKRRNLIF